MKLVESEAGMQSHVCLISQMCPWHNAVAASSIRVPDSDRGVLNKLRMSEGMNGPLSLFS